MRSKEKRRYIYLYSGSVNYTKKWPNLSARAMRCNVGPTTRSWKIDISIPIRSSPTTSSTTIWTFTTRWGRNSRNFRCGARASPPPIWNCNRQIFQIPHDPISDSHIQILLTLHKRGPKTSHLSRMLLFLGLGRQHHLCLSIFCGVWQLGDSISTILSIRSIEEEIMKRLVMIILVLYLVFLAVY